MSLPCSCSMAEKMMTMTLVAFVQSDVSGCDAWSHRDGASGNATFPKTCNDGNHHCDDWMHCGDWMHCAFWMHCENALPGGEPPGDQQRPHQPRQSVGHCHQQHAGPELQGCGQGRRPLAEASKVWGRGKQKLAVQQKTGDSGP